MRVSAVAPFAWEGERTLTSRLQRRDGESYYDTRVQTQIHSPVNWGAPRDAVVVFMRPIPKENQWKSPLPDRLCSTPPTALAAAKYAKLWILEWTLVPLVTPVVRFYCPPPTTLAAGARHDGHREHGREDGHDVWPRQRTDHARRRARVH